MLKMYQGLGAIVRINPRPPDPDYLMQIYIKNLVYHGWDHENKDIKVFTDMSIAKELEHPFAATQSIVTPDKHHPKVFELTWKLGAAEEEGFLTIIQPLQPIIWGYCE